MRRDGYQERTAWVGAGDGMLVFDADNNGLIEGYQELLASPNALNYVIWSQEGVDAHSGFAALSDFDTNQDGKLTSADAGYTQLKIWQDLNQDGKSDAGELKTLSQWNIKSIDIAGAVRDPFLGTANDSAVRNINGNTITHSSTFTLNNGQTREIVDAWLSHDMMNTRYTGDYTLNPKVLFLPTLKGFGEMPDLHVAMSQNAALLTAMETFATKRNFTQLFSDFQAVKAEVRDMLFLWAGVAKNPVPTLGDAGFEGVFSLMPEYHFLKKFMGLESGHTGMWFDEGPFAPSTAEGILAVTKSFDRLLTEFTSELIFQVGANNLFQTGSGFDPWTSTFSGNFAITQSAITQLQTVAASQTDKPGFWNNFMKFLDATKELSDITATEKIWIDTAIKQSTSNALNWTKVVATLNEQQITTSVYKATMNGTQWDDTIVAFTNFNPYAPSPPDSPVKLLGGYGNDKLYGSMANDWLQGGAGNDFLAGSGGSDTYFYESGHDVIAQENPLDTEKDIIQFAAGIKRSDISIKTFTGMDFASHTYLEVKGRGSITIAYSNWWTSPVETIKQLKFSDGTVVNLSDMPVKIMGTPESDPVVALGWKEAVEYYGLDGDDTISGGDIGKETFYGGAGSDVIMGAGGNDILYGEAGNDTLYGDAGNDILVGGAGNDWLEDYIGNDIYQFSSGFGIDRIVDYAGVDTIAFQQGISVDSISISHANDLMRIVVTPNVNEVQFDLASYAGSVPDIEKITFLDGLSLNLLTFRSWVWGATSAQTTTGTASADAILARGGNDIVYGNAGNDTLHGGAGNDTVYGGDGNDIVHGGIGADVLYGDAGNDTLFGDDGADKLYGGLGADTFMFLKETAFKNVDTIFDFKLAENDKLNIKGLLQGYDPLTKAISDFVQITTSGANSIVKVDADGGANGFVQIATLNNITALTDEQGLVNSGHLVVV